jgi:hypothetical protein
MVIVSNPLKSFDTFFHLYWGGGGGKRIADSHLTPSIYVSIGFNQYCPIMWGEPLLQDSQVHILEHFQTHTCELYMFPFLETAYY